MTPGGGRDYVLILDFAQQIAPRAQELLVDSGYTVLVPRSAGEVGSLLTQYADRIAFMVAGVTDQEVVACVKMLYPALRVFLFRGDQGWALPAPPEPRRSWLSSLRSFP